MPSSIYKGAPGAGKSYLAVTEILKANQEGREVWTNVEGLKVNKFPNPDKIHIMDESEISRIWELLPPNALLVLDEAVMYFPRNFGRGHPGTTRDDLKALTNWIVYHRHHGQDLIWICQSDTLLAPVIRQVSDVMVVCHNLGHLGLRKGFRRDWFSPPSARTPYQSDRMFYKSEVFELYKSVIPGASLTTKSGKLIFARWYALPALLLAVGVTWWVLTSDDTLVGQAMHAASGEAVPAAQASPPPRSPSEAKKTVVQSAHPVVAAAPLGSRQARQAQLLGIITRKSDGLCTLIVAQDGRVRFVREPRRFFLGCDDDVVVNFDHRNLGQQLYVGDFLPPYVNFGKLAPG